MRIALIIGLPLVGAGVGAILGAWYGTVRDHSDFPILVVFTIPVGALIGGFAGVVLAGVLS